MSDTSIEWATKVWNPTTGCDRVSPGCDNCYALTMAKRLKAMGSAKYQRDGNSRTSGAGFGVSVHPDTLDIPLSWRKPERIFVDSMSDLFHDQVPDKYIAKVFAVMCHANHHTFQVLTKRHARMRSLLLSDAFRELVFTSSELDPRNPDGSTDILTDYWPLPNVWLGVSAENQQWADIRIPALLDTPAAVRFISAEPLLGPVDLKRHLVCPDCTAFHAWCECRTTVNSDPTLDWVIVGGESGHGARPMRPDWARGLRDQCRAAGVPFLFKQWGEFAPRCTLALCGKPCVCNGQSRSHPIKMRRVGKKTAGRELDGRTWDEYPEAVTV